ncbi:helicase SNF2 family protein [Microtetraspora sp. NBRC 13810]|uniref:DISARM system SNF2-like helicase DrmD n=1 Tax=Microtetraspora sp. NBRC 13810 TaxID=3030990 RepID=UPI0024A266F4|nr:DISARM system SNF2-like helicase DrmD [Microtetraspora sp. NBRC 13810]GLW08700.1 helicase SNF2 family protein [Microtetraspora sp. NBRC 13810]
MTDMPTVPEPGQVVNVRGSAWAVAYVRAQGLSRSPADESVPGLTHVVELQSLEEDRLGQELAVVWELEVGHTVAPDQGLPETVNPDDFDDPDTLAAFVDAVRWGAVTSADANSYQAPFRSGANVEAYQMEPLDRALRSSRTNLLLADDVGLGKTIEAGLVVEELLLRHRARSVVIVCPPSLMLKWQDEMREKFGLEFTIVDSALLAKVRRTHGLAANPFRLYPRVIVSMAWLPSLRAQRLLRDVYGETGQPGSARRFAFDVLVVDEAHHVAPPSPTIASGGRGYAVDSQRTRAVRALAERCEHRLFLSATPHNGYTESFTALLEMIDDRRFSRGAIIDTQALRQVTVRRLKTQLTDKDFVPREFRKLLFTAGPEEQRQFEILGRIIRDTARATRQSGSGDIVGMLLKKRFLSSPYAFARTLEQYTQASTAGAQQVEDEDAYIQETLGSGQSDEEEGEADHPEFTALRRSKKDHPLIANPGEIDDLITWGLGYEHRPDSRLQALIDFLDATCRPDGTRWSNERVVVFTEYAQTLAWIQGVLEQRGYAGGRLSVIRGSTPKEDRETIRARFNAEPAAEKVRVLLATDSAGEGIDLQTYCHRLVNFDIPFNPSRLEQRIGRIDRYGQTRTPLIYQLAPSADSSTYAADFDFMRRIAMKVGRAAEDLGSMNNVIDADIQERFSPTGRRPRRKALDEGSAIIREVLAGGVELNRRLTELSRTYGERKKEMHLTPANMRRVVDTALDLSHQPPLKRIADPRADASLLDERPDAEIFEVPDALAPGWQQAVRGLDTRLDPGVLRPITFDEEAARGRSDLVHIHLGHALMQRAARTLRSSLFSADAPVRRVTAIVIDDLPQSCVLAVSRLVLVGRGGLRLHEEVFLTGARLRGQAMAEEKVEHLLDEALDRGGLALAPDPARRWLTEQWNVPGSALRAKLLHSMERRAERRQAEVTASLSTRREADVARAKEIFAAFRRNLHESRDRLADEIREQEESMLYVDDQQAQRRRDLRTMEDRLDSLGEEEAREIAAIEERYADIRPHVAAAAVVFVLTPADADGELA